VKEKAQTNQREPNICRAAFNQIEKRSRKPEDEKKSAQGVA